MQIFSTQRRFRDKSVADRMNYDFDLDWLYNESRKIGKRPDEGHEERFLELVGKRINDNMSVAEARRRSFIDLYG
jgi:hypothetical protein